MSGAMMLIDSWVLMVWCHSMSERKHFGTAHVTSIWDPKQTWRLEAQATGLTHTQFTARSLLLIEVFWADRRVSGQGVQGQLI